jgi:hypothetical protein
MEKKPHDSSWGVFTIILIIALFSAGCETLAVMKTGDLQFSDSYKLVKASTVTAKESIESQTSELYASDVLLGQDAQNIGIAGTDVDKINGWIQQNLW